MRQHDTLSVTYMNISGEDDMQKIRKLEVLVEENASGAVRPVEVVADVPVSALIPALVEELHLPRTDHYGNRLIYLMRVAPEGRVLPEDKSLLAAGVAAGARLTLDSYVMNGSAARLFKDEQGSNDPTLYTDDTMPDGLAFPALGRDTSAALPAVKKGRKSTRRAFLIMSGAALSVGSVSLGYTAYRLFLEKHAALPANQVPVHVPPQPTQAPTRPALPTMAKAQFVFSLHQQPVRAVSWSPDGSMLASGSIDAQLLLWDTKGTVHVRAQQGGPIRAIAWAPIQGTAMIAVGAGNQVTFLNPLSGAVLAQGNAHTNAVTSLAWSVQQPQLLVSGALDQKAIVWNTAAFRPQTVFRLHTTPVEAVSWASDGQTIGSSSHGGVVRVWNATSGQEVHGYYFDGQTPLRALVFAPMGTMLAVGGDDGIVRLWNGTVCQLQAAGAFGNRCLDTPQRLQAHTKPVRAAAWSPDGRFLATGGDDGKLVIWYPRQSQVPLLTANHNDSVRALVWSPDGKMVATAAGNIVTVWQLL
jgi:WD40 repeat protein